MVHEDAINRRRSKVEMYVHCVWTTKYRAARLAPGIESRIHRCIVAQSEAVQCRVLAIGGTADHVHLVVRLCGKISIADLMRKVKSTSSALFNDLRPENSERFNWQDGYGCFSLWYSQVDKAIAYVHSQKERHAIGDLLDVFEQFDEPATASQESVPYVFP